MYRLPSAADSTPCRFSCEKLIKKISVVITYPQASQTDLEQSDYPC